MNCIVRSRSGEGEWCVVSEKRPCPICGSTQAPCSGNAELLLVSCARCPSDWLLTNGCWLHPSPQPAQPIADDPEESSPGDRLAAVAALAASGA